MVTAWAAKNRLVLGATAVRERKGYYLLAVKENQPRLRRAVEAVVDRACEADFEGERYDGHAAVEQGHGRHEERYVNVARDPEGLPPEWPDAAAVIQVNREREVNGVRTTSSHSDLSSDRGTGPEFAAWVRGRWGIENRLAWVLDLDVVFGEDRSRLRTKHAGANLAMICRVAVSLLRRGPGKGSSVTKRLKAGWDDNDLLQILQGVLAPIVP